MMTLTAVLIVGVVAVVVCLAPAFVAPTVPFGVRIPPDRVDAPVVTRQRRAYFWRTGVLSVVATVVIGVVRYPDLPDRLAIHFNARGVADGFADKSVWTAFSVVFAQAFLTALILGVLWLVYRGRPETDAADPVGSTNRYRRFLRTWGPVALVFAAVADAGLLVAALRTGQAGVRLGARTPGATKVVNRDDDANWKGGLTYANRRDPALLIPKRFGVGWTFNFGHPVAWLILALIIALAVLPALLAH